MFDCVFDGKDADFSDDPLLGAAYQTVKAPALRQAKRYDTNKKISESMKGNQNAKKDSVVEPEPAITVAEPKKELYDPYPGDGIY